MKLNKVIVNLDTTSIKNYLKEIKKYPVLTEQEEKELLLKYKNGDNNALEKLIKHNLRFVVSIAKHYSNEQNNIEDLVNEGNIGLINGIKNFDINSKFKLISYSVHWIKKAILESMSNNRQIRVPAKHIFNNIKAKKIISSLEQKLSRTPTSLEIKEELKSKFKNTEVKEILNLSNDEILSLNSSINSDGDDDLFLIDILPNLNNKSIDNDLIINDNKNIIIDILLSLENRERQIIESYFGLNNKNQLTITDIAFQFNLTEERVRQIKDKTLKKLKNNLEFIEF